MINKLTKFSLISFLSCTSFAYAGGMGYMNEITNSGFIAIEGGYAANSIKNYNFALIGTNLAYTSIKDDQNIAGRVGAGMLFMMDEQVGVTTELGWGYYGRTTLDPSINFTSRFSTRYTLSGFDALIGLAYIQPSFTLSLKGGALIQNMQVNTDAYFNDGIGPDTFSFSQKHVQTAALPAVKVGLAYNFDSNWAITGSYLFAAGSSPELTGSFNVNTLSATLLSNTQNTTLNVGMLGIQYTC